MKLPHLLRLAGVTFVLAGCSTTHPPQGEQGDPGIVHAPPPSTPPPPGCVLFSDLALETSGPLRPGTPIQLRAVARARFPVDSAKVFIIMPEVAVERMNGWRDEPRPRIPVNVRLPPEDSVVGPIAPGKPLELRTRVVIPRPGNYSVYATVRAQDFEPSIACRAPVIDFVHAPRLMLWISDEGGEVTEHDPTRLPAPADHGGRGPRRHGPP